MTRRLTMSRIRSITKPVFLALLLSVLCTTAAFSENRAGDVTMGAFIGLVDFSNEYNYHDSSILGLSLGYNIDEALTAELSGGFASTNEDTAPGSTDSANANIVRLEALYHMNGLFSDTRVLPYFAAGCGVMSFKPDRAGADTNRNFVVTAGGGVKYDFAEGYAVRGDLREVLDIEDVSHPVYSGLMTVAFLMSFGSPPEKVETVEPEAPPVVESIPEVKKPADSDGDGVTDDLDKCPDTPKGVKVDKDGCPEVKPPVDGDGDGDGVPDSRDKCPHTPKGVKVDANGCPEPEKAVVTSRGTYDFGTIHFDFGKATIRPGSYSLLNNVVEYMKKYPDVKLEVQGHTDSVGKAAYNRKLSGKRAASVKAYIVKKGVASSRLTSKGYGMSSPIASNKTKAGRATNRRTEFMPIW
jgi:OmpA-OmpF porin, OOP family